MFTVAITSFFIGAVISGLTVYVCFIKSSSKRDAEFFKLKAKMENSDNILEALKNEFLKIADETIKSQQEDLRRQNREALEEKIFPLSKELCAFREKINDFNIKGVENTTKIVEQIINLEKNNKSIEKETKNLIEALTKNQNTKGAYGENLLENILQSCGMQEGIHYTKQSITKSYNKLDDESHVIRPDIVLYLPNNRHLIIDSKVTLTSYLDYIEDNSKLKNFKNEVKKRIVDLSNKNYECAENLFQPDFILMYMPIESSVSLLYEDSDIIMQAYRANIIIVGTSSLLTTIRLVNQLHSQHKQLESVQQIVNAGVNMYETFVQFCSDLIELQKKMNDISSAFTTTINRFKRNSKNKPSIFSQVEILKQYGINSQKDVPQEFLEDFEYKKI